YLSTNLFSVDRPVSLSLLNTFSKTMVPFEPLEKDKVSVYTCGPTVYKRLNIGQLRRYAFTDLLIRYIAYHGIDINHVVNITDYDDKTIQGAQKAGAQLGEYTQGFFDLFKKDMEILNIRPAEAYPKVSENFDEMIDLTRELQSKQYAYEKLHSLYFDISSFSEYGEFSSMDLDNIKIGATVDLDEYEKRNPKDFTLLKRVKLSELKNGIGVKTQWGSVRPSLHLQCAAMAMKYLGENFDIQTGSRELVFPHHENEVAIARAAKGAGLARHWLHCNPVQLDGSFGEDKIERINLDFLLNQGWAPETIRFCLISNHYRKTLTLSDQVLTQAQYTLGKINRCFLTLGTIKDGEPYGDIDQLLYDIRQGFVAAMQDDLKISGVVSSLLANIKVINRLMNRNRIDPDSAIKILNSFKEIDSVLKIFKFIEKSQYSGMIQTLIKERENAREQKDWKKADKLRDKLVSMGITVNDKKVDA
ncbi:MAG: cysteine--tRNA ligase, partial [Desulfobacula sp.]|nr:cysteine--tRNA ligase [Desulfobacula sp.]